MSAVKVSAKFNEKFFTSISPETVQRVIRESELHERSARKKFLLVRKTKLRLSFANSMVNKPKHTGIMSYLLTKANLTFLVPIVE